MFKRKPRLYTCMNCGKPTPQLHHYLEIGEKKWGGIWGNLPMEVKSILVCKTCLDVLELRKKGLRNCEYCGKVRKIAEKCSNCGAP